MLRRLYYRLFVCRRWGHTPGPPTRGTHGYLNDYCGRCGGWLYPKPKRVRA